MTPARNSRPSTTRSSAARCAGPASPFSLVALAAAIVFCLPRQTDAGGIANRRRSAPGRAWLRRDRSNGEVHGRHRRLRASASSTTPAHTAQSCFPKRWGGVAFFDYDNDGDAGSAVRQRHVLAWDHLPPGKTPTTTALYRNDGRGHFAEVTAGSGLDIPHLRHGRRRRAITTTTARSTSSSPRWAAIVSFTTTAAGRFSDVTAEAGVRRRAGRLEHRCGLARLR